MRGFIILIIVFLYIFGPVFRPIGVWFDTIFLVSLLLTFYNVFILRAIKSRVFSKFYSLFFVFVYAIISVVITNGYADGELLRFGLIPIRIFITLYGGFTIVLIVKKYYRENYFKVLLQFAFLSILGHALIMIVQLYNPAFKDLIYLYTSTGEFRSTYDYDFRMGGLSGSSGGSVLSVVQSLGVILIPVLYKKVGFKWKLLLLIGGGIIFYSILICGRSGIWSTLIFLPVFVFLISKGAGLRLVVKFSFIILLLISVLIGALSFLGSADSESSTSYALTRSLDTFLKFEKTSNFEDKTVETVADMWLMPAEISVFVAGDAEHLVNTQFERKLNSDIGYVRNVWGYGIIFAICFWLPIFKLTTIAFRNRKFNDAAKLLFVLSLVMMTFHAKENFMYVRMFLSVYSITLFTMYLDTYNKHNKKTI